MITKQSAFLHNRATILEFLYRNPATSRTDIVNETGLTPATTTNIKRAKRTIPHIRNW